MDVDVDKSHRLVYLTVHADVWFREINPKFNVPMVNRLAKIIKVFDWDTDEGRLLLSEREKTGKWGKLDPKAFKFVLRVYCPELIVKNRRGFTTEEVLPLKYPGTELTLFELLPLWMLQSLQKEEKDVLRLVDIKSKSDVKSNVSGKLRKKSK
jgi:hypothetical protein